MVRGSFGSRTEPARRSRHRFSPSSEEFFAAEPTSQTAPGCVRTVEPISSRKAILVTFTISKTKLAVAIIAAALTIPTSAMAFHVFDDVPDDKFYAEPVEWAFDNGITTGKTATMFAPDDAVTRGESVTFLKRYNDNVVEPTTMNLFASDTKLGGFSTASNTPSDVGLSAVVTIPEGHSGVIEIGFSAESACYGGAGSPWCKVILYSNGTAVGDDDFAFDSSDGASETANSWEAHAMTRVTDELAAGTYTITARGAAWWHSPTFALDDMVLTAEVHLTS